MGGFLVIVLITKFALKCEELGVSWHNPALCIGAGVNGCYACWCRGEGGWPRKR